MKTKTKTKAKAKSAVRLMTVTAPIEIPKDGWKKEVTRPEDLSERELDAMTVLVFLFVLHRAPAEVFLVCKALFELHYQVFIERESMMAREYPRRIWSEIPLEERRRIYRDVGLILGYDF